MNRKLFFSAGNTPTLETSPQVSRKNSLVSRCSPLLEDVHHHQHHHRETVIRFQLENEMGGSHHPIGQSKTELIKIEGAQMAAAVGHQLQSGSGVGETLGDVVIPSKDAVSAPEGSNRLGQLYFKVRYGLI